MVCLALVMVSLAVLAVGFTQGSPPDRVLAAGVFQGLVGGLGGGPSVDLVCPAHLDPRLDGECRFDSGPIPGGSLVCPRCGRELLSAAVGTNRSLRRSSRDVGVR